MKTIFDDHEYSSLLQRIDTLSPASTKQWGSMDVAQMIAHCNRSISLSLGLIDGPSESTWLLRTLVKPMVLSRCIPFWKNAPTSNVIRVAAPADFAQEKQHLLENLATAKTRGLNGPWKPHIAFGPLSAKEWGRLHLKHLDHHLRQFSA